MNKVKLGNLASIQTGKIDVNKAVVGGRYPFFTCSREVYEIDEAPFEGKAVLVAGNGDLNVKYYEGKFNAYQRTYFLFVNNEEELLPRYLYWFLESHVGQLRLESIGSTIKYIKMGNLTEAEIPLHSLDKQKEIVEKLDNAFAEISSLEESLDLCDTKATELIQSLLSASFEQSAIKPESSSPLVARAHSNVSVALKDFCKMYQPPTISTKEMIPNGEFVVYGANGPIGRYDRFNHEEPQLLVTCRGATCGAVNISEPFSWINGNAMVIQPNLDLATLEYMKYAFLGGIDVSSSITGSAQPQITRTTLEVLKVPLPALEQQRAIVSKLDIAFAEIEKIKNQIAIKQDFAAMLRQSLLSNAFSPTSEMVSA
jgi:restriction endonuclease S subunit